MLTYLRYALATVCFAVSVGCVALWWRSMFVQDVLIGPSYVQPVYGLMLETLDGVCVATAIREGLPKPIPRVFPRSWGYSTRPPEPVSVRPGQMKIYFERHGAFMLRTENVIAYFPLWYPALISGFAGVAVLRVRRQFSIRSALVATTVVAALIAMAVIL